MLRVAFKRELLPAPVLWLLAADGMCTWLRWLRRGLPESPETIARWIEPAYVRRVQALGFTGGPKLLVEGLYPVPKRPTWLFGRASALERIRAWRAVRPMSYRERWIEVATHLGEVLIVLSAHVPASVLGRICHDAGVRYGERAARRWQLPRTPASAIEVLRIGEYIFRVNPEHWGHADATSGSIEGTACPWFVRPGWDRVHCGIFGQFQSGVSSVFGLKYQLTKTIPRHGGDTCKVDLVQLPSPARGA